MIVVLSNASYGMNGTDDFNRRFEKMDKRKLEIFVDTHLQLCEACENDAETIYHAIDLHRDDLRRWLPFVDGLHSVAEEKNFLSGLCAEAPEVRNYTFKILFDDVFCELVGFVFTDTVNRKTEIGYWLLPEFRGHGIMSRCVARLCLWAFDVREMNRVQIKCAVGNHPSNAIPRRLGFRLEGVERAGEYAGEGRYYDLNVYSLLAQEKESLSSL